MPRRIWIVALLVTLLLISACGLFQGAETPTETTISETPDSLSEPTPLPQSTLESDQPTVVTNTIQTLRVWVPPELAVQTELGTVVLQEQLNNYALSQSDLEIILETKLFSGQGGILSYLRTGRNIAPEILPDLIAIPANQLNNVHNDELITPLNELIDSTAIDNLYPAAQEFATADELILGYPFALTELTHFAYNNTQITQTISSDWDSFILTENLNFSVPMGGSQGGVLLLQLYLASGGTLVNEAGQQSIQVDTLAFALNKLQNAVEESTLNLAVSQNALSEELWEAYLLERTNLILTSSENYLRQVDLSNTAVSAISGIETGLPPIVNGWAWAISTPNGGQQALTVGLLNHLTSVESVAVWSESSAILPANSNVLTQWTIEGNYLEFIQGELSIAEPIPIEASNALVDLLQNAALQVISGDASPQAAATEVATAYQE